MDSPIRRISSLRPVVLAFALVGSGEAWAADYDYLEQGWNQAEREEFYFTTQGSQLVPYDWFLALEQATNDKPFRDDAHMDRLRFITQGASLRNPDALPIGFVKDDNPEFVFDYKRAFLGEAAAVEDFPRTNTWVGLTCAACHTTQIEHQGATLLVDGGPAMADAETFLTELAEALRATHQDDAKLTRLAEQVLVPGGPGEAGGVDPEEKETLRKSVAAYADILAKMIQRNAAPTKYGYARLDAFGAILNEVCATSLGIPANERPADAPASFPCLWDTPELDWVQWNGSASKPMRRNVGEVLGVFGHYALSAADPADQFQSTVRVQNLFRLEGQIDKLQAPQWPEKYLGAIDQAKAQRGAVLYKKSCQECHGIRGESGHFPLTEPNSTKHRFIKIVMVPLAEAGTDPRLAFNFLRPNVATGSVEMFETGSLAPFLDPPFKDQAKAPRPILLRAAVDGVIDRQMQDTLRPGTELTCEQQDAIDGYHDELTPTPQHLLSYKARPLDGVWATAPYLHNGSVPNLYQLLLPAKDRVKTFYVGSREFDPKHVGFSTEAFDGGYEFRTTDADGVPLVGNSNRGHEGQDHTQTVGADGVLRDFTEDERWELVEYMKTLY